LLRSCPQQQYFESDHPSVDPYPNFTTVDVAASLLLDGLHPNVAGYAKMWAVIAPLLNESLQ